MQRTDIFLFLLVASSFQSCLKPKLTELEFLTVFTDPIQVVAPGSILLKGRIDGLTDQQAETCGFLWSTDEAALSGPLPVGQVLPVAPPPGNGLIESTFDIPEPEKVYFFRAFAKLGARHVFADVVRAYAFGAVVFSTGSSQVINDTCWVQGFLAGLSTDNLAIDAYGHILSLTNPRPELDCADCRVTNLGARNDDGLFTSRFDSLQFNTSYFVRAYAVAGSKRFYSSKTDTIRVQDGWRRTAGFQPFQQGLAVTTTNPEQVFVGFGCTDQVSCDIGSLPRDFWKLTGLSADWEMAAPFTGLLKRTNAGAFAIGDTVYIIFGSYDTLGVRYFVRNFYKYSISGNSWTKGQDPGPECARRERPVAFVLNGKGYIGSGLDQNGNALQDFWEYDTANAQWRKVADLPARLSANGPDEAFGRYEAASFQIGQHAYVGGGMVGSTFLTDFWRYTPPANATDPGYWDFWCFFDKGKPRAEAVWFTLDGKGYYGLGYTNTNEYLDDFFEFDPDAQSWTERQRFPGGGRRDALGFSLLHRGFVGTGFQRIIQVTTSEAIRSDMWQYEPRQ